jgi:hypothetical protein
MGSNQSKMTGMSSAASSSGPARDTALAVRVPRPSDNIGQQWTSYGISRVIVGGFGHPPQLQLIFSCGTFSPAEYTRYQHDLQAHVMTTIDAPESFAITVVQGLHARPAFDFVRHCRTGVMDREALCSIYDSINEILTL